MTSLPPLRFTLLCTHDKMPARCFHVYPANPCKSCYGGDGQHCFLGYPEPCLVHMGGQKKAMRRKKGYFAEATTIREALASADDQKSGLQRLASSDSSRSASICNKHRERARRSMW